jgi:hypothetical protein
MQFPYKSYHLSNTSNLNIIIAFQSIEINGL